jgi:hypothetical protein
MCYKRLLIEKKVKLFCIDKEYATDAQLNLYAGLCDYSWIK